ncbi:DNA-3-methyladenine glycosylase [Ilumatobacter sp.]|uniref:DNA-3-methyladenine glycosylase n=1 Tax=Ilumatobacter sp. TaxID=1967498 RepID=UPI003B515E23
MSDRDDGGVRRLGRAWFGRDAPVVAAELLGKLIVHELPAGDGGRAAGRIVEVEAYTEDDPASHTHRGRTPRTEVMFGPPAHLYVYLSYGIHACANVVTGPDGDGQAVLLRAVVPVEGVEAMRARRGGRGDRALADGPGKLTQALGIELRHDGHDLAGEGSTLSILDDGVDPPTTPVVGPRVGITRATSTPWRFRVPSG